MAATSKGGRECAGRGANLLARRRAFDHRNGLSLRVHLHHYRNAVYTAARLGQTVAGAWVGQAVARWDVGRCRALCQEVVRDCQWASVAGEELGFAQPYQAPQPQDAQRQVACREAQGVLLAELEQAPDVFPRVGPQEHQAWDAQERAWGPQQAVPERPQVPQASLLLEKLARLQVPWVPLDAQRERQERARHWVRPERFLAQQELADGRRADALLADGPQARGRQERVPLGRP